jgi:hypothetical protein
VASTIDSDVFHVQPDGPMWAVRVQEGSALSQHDTKRAAVQEGRRTAVANQPSDLVIHRGDGTIENAASY